ncbi:flagellar hook assembly protein FlgD [Halobacillus fulvus]|nr:flagellar hook assembly protein FlgD [Halobacillus fulvus]
MTSIDPSFYLQNQTTRGTGSNTLGKDDFLKILMAQIQNQSPLDPMKDKEFIAQMTQFSSLEQMTNMSQSFQSFTESQSLPPVIQYSHMIGKEVAYPVYDEVSGALDRMEKGIVTAVSQKDGETKLDLASGLQVAVESITKVSEPSETKEELNTDD